MILLWGVTSGGGSKNFWAKCSDVCRSKNDGGLGVKDVKAFNLFVVSQMAVEATCGLGGALEG
jgi:hypothetical protein